MIETHTKRPTTKYKKVKNLKVTFLGCHKASVQEIMQTRETKVSTCFHDRFADVSIAERAESGNIFENWEMDVQVSWG